MRKLISMTDYVLEYANFLKQPLELWMFVPCDEDGSILEEPIETIGGVEMYSKFYKQAKEKVIFKNFIYDEEIDVVRNNYGVEIYLGDDNLTIEDLTKYNLDYEANDIFNTFEK